MRHMRALKLHRRHHSFGPGRGQPDGIRPDRETALRQGQHVVPAHEARDELCRGRVEHVTRAARLFDLRVVHHHDLIRQGQRLVLTVGDMDETDPELALQPLQFCPHPHPQERVKRGQRFIQQQDLRVGDQRAGQRHALLLTAGQLRGKPVGIGGHVDKLQQRARLFPAGRGLDALHLQAEGDVVGDGQMREQRIALEHHRRSALRGRQGCHVLGRQQDRAFGCAFVPRDHAQRRGLAAAGRPQQADIAARAEQMADVRHRNGPVAVALGYMDKFQVMSGPHRSPIVRSVMETRLASKTAVKTGPGLPPFLRCLNFRRLYAGHIPQ